MSKLKNAILNKKAKIGIIGLGFVGIPYMIAFCEKGFDVTGFDLSEDRIELLRKGISPISDINNSDIQNCLNQNLKITTDFQELSSCGVILVCVPTPCDESKIPNLNPLKEAAKSILQNIKSPQLIIVQSTSYPGTTTEIFQNTFESKNLKLGVDYFLAFSPERVDPGNKNFNIKNTPKVVGADNQESLILAESLLSIVVEKVHTVGSTKSAEITKLLENSFRLINISFINEFSLLCQKMDIDPIEVINAASTKPFGFMPFYPSSGVGGHCIPVDPYYLSWRAKIFDFTTRFIDLANEINEQMPYKIVDELKLILDQKKEKSVKNSKLLVVGITFKPDVADTRNSPSIKIVSILLEYGADIDIYDPYVTEINLKIKNKKICLKSVLKPNNAFGYDAVVILTKHKSIDYQGFLSSADLVYQPFNKNI